MCEERVVYNVSRKAAMQSSVLIISGLYVSFFFLSEMSCLLGNE